MIPGIVAARAAAGGGSPSTYSALVASYAPNLWWKLDETSGTTAANSGSDGSGSDGTLTGGASFASSGVSIAAPAGYSGLGTGVDPTAASFNDIRDAATATNYMSSTFTVVLWVAGSAGASQYLLCRANDAAIIYQFVSDTVEFFSLGYTGSNPRTGSGISLPAADTTTPRMIVYRYDGTTWSGFKDGASVFSVTRTFGIPNAAANQIYLASDSAVAYGNSKTWDAQIYNTALSDAQILAMWNARDIP